MQGRSARSMISGSPVRSGRSCAAAVAIAKQSPSAIGARAFRRATSIIRAVPGRSGASAARRSPSVSSASPWPCHALLGNRPPRGLPSSPPGDPQASLNPRERRLLAIQPRKHRPGIQTHAHRGSRARSSSKRAAIPVFANRPPSCTGDRRATSTISSSRNSKSTSSPGCKRARSRNAFGITTCPLAPIRPVIPREHNDRQATHGTPSLRWAAIRPPRRYGARVRAVPASPLPRWSGRARRSSGTPPSSSRRSA